ncbi:hypothetical protein ETAE_2259 [Edwardsiella piscicida]|uniref:Uncharacterized protein n=1 Tax=Edwardsiella piscicida TaxID=1263550 RepID=A0AAU8PGP2_EDWPI|nr:hypothetical protein ETAE_2259 [Edwardsiella tarda EIB202]GBK57032.1 hypothetical protein JFPO14_contig00003-0229 [Edwardsiella piscicida]
MCGSATLFMRQTMSRRVSSGMLGVNHIQSGSAPPPDMSG